MTFGGNMGYYMLDYYFIYNGQVDHEVELVIDDSGSKTKYSSKGETITEAEYNDIVEEYEEAYPEDEMMHISYDDAYEINAENIKSILYGRAS